MSLTFSVTEMVRVVNSPSNEVFIRSSAVSWPCSSFRSVMVSVNSNSICKKKGRVMGGVALVKFPEVGIF